MKEEGLMKKEDIMMKAKLIITDRIILGNKEGTLMKVMKSIERGGVTLEKAEEAIDQGVAEE
jgi:hypothetical protein